jgi:hypothetical protein
MRQKAAHDEINRATAARWVAGARLAIVSETRAVLAGKLGIATSEVDNIIRLVRSQLSLACASSLDHRARVTSTGPGAGGTPSQRPKPTQLVNVGPSSSRKSKVPAPDVAVVGIEAMSVVPSSVTPP